MNAGEIISAFRSEVDDVAAPYLWADDDVWRYLNKAEEWFCRLIGGLSDSRSDLTKLICPAGREYVDLSPKILRIKDARLAADGRVIDIYNYPDLNRPIRSSLSYEHMRPARLDATTGVVYGLVLGLSENTARPVNIAAVTTEVRLIIERTPLCAMESPADTPEIDPCHHDALLIAMKSLAFGSHQAEAFNKGKADGFQKSFEAYCKAAKAEKERKQAKVRITVYGGI